MKEVCQLTLIKETSATTKKRQGRSKCVECSGLWDYLYIKKKEDTRIYILTYTGHFVFLIDVLIVIINSDVVGYCVTFVSQ